MNQVSTKEVRVTNQATRKPVRITIEGSDASGKSTIGSLIAAALATRGFPPVSVRGYDEQPHIYFNKFNMPNADEILGSVAIEIVETYSQRDSDGLPIFMGDNIAATKDAAQTAIVAAHNTEKAKVHRDVLAKPYMDLHTTARVVESVARAFEDANVIRYENGDPSPKKDDVIYDAGTEGLVMSACHQGHHVIRNQSNRVIASIVTRVIPCGVPDEHGGTYLYHKVELSFCTNFSNVRELVYLAPYDNNPAYKHLVDEKNRVPSLNVRDFLKEVIDFG